MFDYSNPHCAQCGSKTEKQIPEGDHNERDVCTSCGFIHYVNPKLITGALPVHNDKILLCKRNIEPRKGCWTLPAGFMECNETTAEGAARETFEESEAKLKNITLYGVYDLPHISQVYMFFRAELDGDHIAPTPESSEVGLFDEADIPWHELAFPVVKSVLKSYFRDRAKGEFGVYNETMEPLKKSR